MMKPKRETMVAPPAEMADLEEILGYKLKNKVLLVEAMTHSSCAESASYQRFEFIGDSALGFAISKYLYIKNPKLGPGPLTILRAAIVSTENLACLAVHHGLYKFLIHNCSEMDKNVRLYS
ncbi:Ribonuclease 3-like protein 2 [Acorus calamus]|uniref:Ribonuclease 3-like protein 2 n=1 Tax=Acorus calamus TaxID=4465 RepID=A0AAV9FJL6_ACOCL|nr:Ribonuclease 3-like protein 2 [Acorus calamus]